MVNLLSNQMLPLWKSIARQTFTKLESLADFLELNQDQRAQLVLSPSFPLKVPLRLAQKMAKGTLDDPIIRQFLPLQQEMKPHANFLADPVCDVRFQVQDKLLQKYAGRVLITCTGACAMHCRYCFRQNFAYAAKSGFSDEIAWIAQQADIHEVILSGGDPLSLDDALLSPLLQGLGTLCHIKKIRFHTRFPIGIPERIDVNFLALIKAIPQQVYFVIHCNHARELDADILERLRALQSIGCVLLNQAVLLKGVNDNVGALKELCEVLANHGILPYYLHQLDRIQGGEHFEVDVACGRLLIEQISRELPGYCVPKYVQEIAGEPNKTPLM